MNDDRHNVFNISMILNLPSRLPVDPRGKISSGGTVKATTAAGKEYDRPVKYDYFDVSDFAELHAAYGDTPREIVVAFPSDNPDDFFSAEYAAWGRSASGAMKKRTCDGETCIVRLAHKVGDHDYGAGEEAPCACDAANLADDDKDRCKASMTMRAFVADPTSEALKIMPTLYRFTSGYSSATNIRSELLRVLGLTAAIEGRARLTRIPFVLSVHMASKSDDAKSTFPVWDLHARLAIGTQFFALKAPPEGAPLLLSGATAESAPAPETPIMTQAEDAAGGWTYDTLRADLKTTPKTGVVEWLDAVERFIDPLEEPARSELFALALRRIFAEADRKDVDALIGAYTPICQTLTEEYRDACREAARAAKKAAAK